MNIINNKVLPKTIDPRLLQVFLVIYELQSVSGAALQLQLDQSTVSNTLDRLRKLLGDRLFVRAGRGITPTAHADKIVPIARDILEQNARLVAAANRSYDPSQEHGRFTISTLDYEWSLLGQRLMQILRTQAPHCELKIITLGTEAETLASLRSGEIDFAMRPSLSEDSTELHAKCLIGDHLAAFYDAAHTHPPQGKHYWQASHARVVFSQDERSTLIQRSKQTGQERAVRLIVPNFSFLANAIEGTNLVVTAPSLLRYGHFRNLSHCKPPFEVPVNIHAIWHQAVHQNPRHRWLLQQLQACASNAVETKA